MGLIDEKGRLLGKINVIDLGVLLLVAVVLLAAARFTLFSGAPVDVHAQVEAADVPASVASAMTAGSTWDDGRVQVTDVHVVPTGEETRRVFAKVLLRAEQVDGGIRFGQTALAPGARVPLTVAGTTFPAEVVLLDGSPDLVRLQGPTPTLFIAREVELPVGDGLANGSVGRLGDGSLVTVSRSRVVPVLEGAADVFVAGERVRFGRVQGDPAEPGESVTLSFRSGQLTGTLRDMGDGEGPAFTVERVPVRIQAQAPASSNAVLGTPSLLVGAEERVAGEVLARFVDATLLDRATVNEPNALNTGEDGGSGTIRARIDLELLAVRYGPVLEHRGTPVGPGSEVSFRTQDVDLAGRVLSVGPADGALSNVTVTLLVRNVPPWAASAIEAGDAETTAAGDTLADVVEVQRVPARVVVATGDGQLVARSHPDNLDLTLILDLTTPGRPVYKDRPLTLGQRLFLQIDGVPLQGTITGIGP